MSDVECQLTPELAARLLANPHPKQRKISRQIVENYARAIREGRWRLVRDPLLIVGTTFAGPSDPDGSMFNGGHRCQAVIAAHRTIPVYIDWDADPSTFDLIDIGRKRNAAQFVTATYATARSAAARMLLWYEHRFDRAPLGAALSFDLHEVLAEIDRWSDTFDRMIACASRTWEYTALSSGVALAAYSIASSFGYEDEVQAFVGGVCDPIDLNVGDPARLLSERFRQQSHRARRRSTAEDWTILVRALNLHLEGKLAGRLQMSEFWPRVAESDVDWNRRRNTASAAKKAHEDQRVRESRRAGSA